MTACGKPMPGAKNGAARGFCRRSLHHSGACQNKTCLECGSKLTIKNSTGDSQKRSLCSFDRLRRNRRYYSHKPKNFQISSRKHKFACGCSGVLPESGKSNKFAVWATHGRRSSFQCRVAVILHGSQSQAKQGDYCPIPLDTPHLKIRRMMNSPCKYCGKVLLWNNPGRGKTPHLHHSHETAEIYGFMHMPCHRRVTIIEEKDRQELAEQPNGVIFSE